MAKGGGFWGSPPPPPLPADGQQRQGAVSGGREILPGGPGGSTVILQDHNEGVLGGAPPPHLSALNPLNPLNPLNLLRPPNWSGSIYDMDGYGFGALRKPAHRPNGTNHHTVRPRGGGFGGRPPPPPPPPAPLPADGQQRQGAVSGAWGILPGGPGGSTVLLQDHDEGVLGGAPPPRRGVNPRAGREILTRKRSRSVYDLEERETAQLHRPGLTPSDGRERGKRPRRSTDI